MVGLHYDGNTSRCNRRAVMGRAEHGIKISIFVLLYDGKFYAKLVLLYNGKFYAEFVLLYNGKILC